MSPLSLLFSSDEETSRALAQALEELELTVESCTEIFGAVEKITARGYEVVVCDCDEGPEAAFLLKTTHELKSNQAAFTIAVSSPNNPLSRDVRAHLLLTKPIRAQEAKYALLTCDKFLTHMKTWLPKLGFPAAEPTHRSWPGSERAIPRQVQPSIPISPRPRRPSPLPLPIADDNRRLDLPSFALAGPVFQGSGVQSLFYSGAKPASGSFKPQLRKSWLRMAALAAVFLSVGYVFSEPLRSESVASSVAGICNRALERTQSWFHSSEVVVQASTESAARRVSPRPVDHYAGLLPHHASADNGGASSRPGARAEDQDLVAQVQPAGTASPVPQSRVPESLKTPLHAPDPRIVASAIGPSFLAALEPVSLPEELAQKLILEKIQPSYPEKALRAGMQGPVVLQAWIARDGTIRDLKLVRGSFLLGQAAYRAVKQWRYQPYLLNGKPVEAQTLVTIDFRLP